MPSATNPESDPPLDARRILVQSLAVMGSNAGAPAMLTALIHLPLLAAQLYLTVAPTVEIRTQMAQSAILMGARLFLSALSTTAVIHGAFQQIQGKAAGFGECLRAGVARTPTVLLISLVTLAPMFASLALLLSTLFVVVMPLLWAVVSPGLFGPSLFAVVTLFLSGLFAVTTLFVAAPAALAEELGVIGALRRSAELTRGSRRPVFNLVIAPVSLLMLLLTVRVEGKDPLANPRVQAVIWLVMVLYQALTSVTMAITYFTLRRKQEGARKADLAGASD